MVQNVQEKKCANCGEPLGDRAYYCPRCGQKVYAGKIPLKDLFHELLDAFFSLDNKIFRTLKAMLVPGRLPLLFFEGQRKRFVHPARIFLVTAILFLAILNYVLSGQITASFKDNESNMEQEAYENDLREQIQGYYDSLKTQRIRDPGWQAALDTFMLKIGSPQIDSMNFDYVGFDFKNGFKGYSVSFDQDEFFNLHPDSLVQKYNIETPLGRTIIRQTVRVVQNQSSFWQFALGQVTWMLLIMMPAIALVLKALYWRRKRYFIEHLYFSFYTHAFLFILLSLTAIIAYWRDEMYFIPFVLAAVYVYWAMLNYYKQGWFKTLFKFGFVFVSYQVIIIIFLSFTFLISGLMFA